MSMGAKCPWGPNVCGTKCMVAKELPIIFGVRGTKCPSGSNVRGDQISVEPKRPVNRSQSIKHFHHILRRKSSEL